MGTGRHPGKFGEVETENAGLPVGGTTGHCHQSTAAIDEAAAWFAANRDTCERPICNALMRRFGLRPIEAVEAIRAANRITGYPILARHYGLEGLREAGL